MKENFTINFHHHDHQIDCDCHEEKSHHHEHGHEHHHEHAGCGCGHCHSHESHEEENHTALFVRLGVSFAILAILLVANNWRIASGRGGVKFGTNILEKVFS